MIYLFFCLICKYVLTTYCSETMLSPGGKLIEKLQNNKKDTYKCKESTIKLCKYNSEHIWNSIWIHLRTCSWLNKSISADQCSEFGVVSRSLSKTE